MPLPLLGGGGEFQDIVAPVRGARVEPPDVRLTERQGPGLVEDHGIILLNSSMAPVRP